MGSIGMLLFIIEIAAILGHSLWWIGCATLQSQAFMSIKVLFRVNGEYILFNIWSAQEQRMHVMKMDVLHKLSESLC